MTNPEVRRRRITVGSMELDVWEAGDPGAPPVILSHGFPESAHSWRHQIPALAAAGYHVLVPDLLGLLDTTGQQQAVFVGHDWGALIVWELARLYPERVGAVVGVSVPYVAWPGRPTDLMRMLYGDRFFYILYFQTVGPPEAELEADVRTTMATVLYGASGAGWAARGGGLAELPPMEGTGFLTLMAEPPPLPFLGPEGPWLTAADLDDYTDGFTASGFFGPVSYYRNLDANFERVKDLGAERLAMPSYFIGGSLDPVLVMDPGGVERMQKLLPDFRGSTIIDGAGHWTQQEAPAAFNEALLGFLAGL